MNIVLASLLVGALVGVIFSLIKLPIPAPPTLAGIAGIVGLWLGYIAVNYGKTLIH